MGYPSIYPSGLLLQTPSVGSSVLPYSGLAMLMEAGAALPLGTLVMIDSSDPDTVVAQGAATPELLAGVVVGSAFNGKIDYVGAPEEGGLALIAVPPCRVKVLAGATVAAGAVLMVDSTDGRVATWTDGHVRLGYAVTGGSDGDLITVHLQTSVSATSLGSVPISTIEAGEELALGSLVMIDAADPTTVLLLDASTPELFYGVVTGELVDGIVTVAVPDATDTAVIALPTCVADVILDETVAAGASLMPTGTAGRVVAWTPGNYLIGYALEGGDQDDVISAYLTPVQKPYSGPVLAYEAGTTLPVGSLLQIDPAAVAEAIPLDSAGADLFLGATLGVMADGRIDTSTAPTDGDTAAIALLPCVATAILDETVAAGCPLMPASVDGRVVAWLPDNYLVGYALEAGIQDAVVSAYLTVPQKPYSGQVQHFIAGATIPVGSLVEVEAATPTDIQVLDATSPYLFVGVVLGTMVDGRIDTATAPDEGDIAAVAIPPCTVDVILDATIAAGVPLMPDADTDGRVDAWTDTNHMVGFTLAGGDQNDVVSAHIFPIKLFVTE